MANSHRGFALLLLALGLPCPGCGPERPAVEPVGRRRLAHDIAEPAASPSAPPAGPPWSHLGAVRKWPRANTQRFVAEGHLFGKYQGDIHVNDLGAQGYAKLSPGRTLPTGSVVAMVHADGPIFAMEKGPAGWTYVETDARGQVLRSGRLQPCADCHAHVASQDELFGVPTTGR